MCSSNHFSISSRFPCFSSSRFFRVQVFSVQVWSRSRVRVQVQRPGSESRVRVQGPIPGYRSSPRLAVLSLRIISGIFFIPEFFWIRTIFRELRIINCFCYQVFFLSFSKAMALDCSSFVYYSWRSLFLQNILKCAAL